MTDQRPDPDRPDPNAPTDRPGHADPGDDAAKVPLEDETWKKAGADAPDAADIDDPGEQL